MRFFLFKYIIIFSAVIILYTTICSTQAIAQDKKSEDESPPILVKKDDAKLAELKQIDNTVTVKTVIDGKTFTDLDGNTYALASLDIQFDAPYARQAKEQLEELIMGKTLILFQTKNPKFGRQNHMGHTIVHALTKDTHTWVQATLLANGAARVRTTPYTYEHVQDLLNHELDARNNKRGIWKDDAFDTLTPDTAIDHIGSFQIVEGKIKKVAVTKNNIYLNFGDNWKNDFTIGIEPSVRRALAKKNITVQNWTGKDIQMRGWIRLYNGPYIDLTHEQQIQLFDPIPKDIDSDEQDTPTKK